MSDDSQADSVSLLSGDENDTWVSGLFKITGTGDGKLGAAAAVNTAASAGNPGRAGAGATGAAAASGSGACTTPDATATDFFFDYNSSELTSSDKTTLEAYAKAFLGSKISEPIILEGFASIEGDEGKNKSLSKNRANQVANYLIARKVPKGSVKFEGK